MKRYLFTTWALTKLFTLRYFRSRVAIFFSVLFPLILLFIFGGIFGSSNGTTFKVAIDNQSKAEFAQTFAKALGQNKIFKVQPLGSLAEPARHICDHWRVSSRPMIIRITWLVPSRIEWTRRSRQKRSIG